MNRILLLLRLNVYFEGAGGAPKLEWPDEVESGLVLKGVLELTLGVET